MHKRLTAVAVIVLFGVPLIAQLPTSAEHIQVTLVEVPVNVIDRNGDPVRNLTAANFELLDNGRRQAITHFDAVDLTAASNTERSRLPEAAASRNFLILFDVNSSAPGTLTRAREAAQAFVNSAGIQADRVGVATFSAENGFRLLTSFTTDMKLVSAAISSVGTPRLFQPVDPLLLSANEMREAANEAESQRGVSTPALVQEFREYTRNLDRAANDVQRQFIRRTLDGYGDLARLLDRVGGRKQVILLTEGFDAKMIHGRELLTTAQAREEERYIQTGEAWRVDTDNRFGDVEVSGELKGMIEVCRRSDVVLHAIDIRGVRTNPDARDAGEKSNESLFLLTHDTGGLVFKNANSLSEDFRRLVHAQEVVYVLGFQAPSNAPGNFHDLKVKLVNVPGGTRALHRAGYFETSPANTAVERTLTAAEIIVNQIAVSDLHVRTLATPFPRRDGRAQVPVIVEVDGTSFMRAAKGNQIQSELFIYAFDQNNQIRDFVHQPIALDLVKLRNRLQQHGVRVYETLMLPSGRYSIRTLVRAGSETLYGFNSTTIDVPAYDQSAVLGGTAIDERPAEWVPVKPPDRQGVPHDYPFSIGGSMLVPAASPVFHPGVATQVGLYVEKLPADNVDVAATVNGQATPVKIAARTVAPDGTAKLLLDFIPPQLPPGDYQLTLRVPQGEAVVPFAVR